MSFSNETSVIDLLESVDALNGIPRSSQVSFLE